jgi:hypothetical protein
LGISAEVGSPIKISVAPRLLLRLMGPFNTTIRELEEMPYEFRQPFIVDSTTAQTRLGLEPTPIGNAIASRRSHGSAPTTPTTARSNDGPNRVAMSRG